MTRGAIALVLLFAVASMRAHGGELPLDFRAAAPEFASAAREYETIWRAHGERIVVALERQVGVELPPRRIEVIVREAISRSGLDDEPMQLRASYPVAVKRGTLVHELGHRYLDQLRLPRSALSEHQRLGLVLMPVWRELWGDDFVAAQIEVESRWSAEYARSWAWVRALSDDERERQWEALLRQARRGR